MARIKTDYVNGGYTFALDWETVYQDYENNLSQVKVVVKLISNGASYTINSTAVKDLILSINGKDYTTSCTVGLSGNQVKTLFTKTVIVPHNADGTKLLSIDATLAIKVTLSDVWYENFWTGDSVYLAQIPRESSIASVTENVVVNGTNKLTVNITRKYSAYKHSVSIRLGDYVHTIENVDTQCQYTIPTSWLGAIPNTVTGTGTVFVTTFWGTKKIGSTYSKDFKVTVPNDYIPSFTDISLQRIDNDVPADWGIYVQNYSDCKATIVGAAGIYGSSIKKYEIEIGDIKGTASTVTANLPKAGTITIKGTVTDSRGRKVSSTKTITVVPYTLPVFDSIKLFRANSSGVETDEGTYIGGKIDFSYAHIGTNSVATSIEYKLPNATDWIYAGTYADGQSFTLGGNLNIDKSYDVRIGLADEIGWIGKVQTLGTGFTTIDLLKGGKGIAFGKVAELQNVADFGFRARFRGGVTIDGGITPDHMKSLKAITQESEIGQYVRLLYFPFRMDNYNSYNITFSYAETIYGEINGFLDFHLRTLVNRFGIKKLQTRAHTGTAAQSDFYADFKDGICSIYWKPATEYARLKMTVFQWAAYENTEIEPSNLYVLDGTHVFSSIGSDYIRVTHL